LLLVSNFTVLNGDEGTTLQGAERILPGQVLYRDFFSFYAPGSTLEICRSKNAIAPSIPSLKGVLNRPASVFE
jgi:hypothetical protein